MEQRKYIFIFSPCQLLLSLRVYDVGSLVFKVVVISRFAWLMIFTTCGISSFHSVTYIFGVPRLSA
jgi:hypothetical protein